MLPRLNGVVWMEEREDRDAGEWARTAAAAGAGNSKDEMGSLSNFKSMLEVEDEWTYMNNNGIQGHSDVRDLTFSPSFADPESLLLNQVDSSSSCSPSSSVFNNLDPSQVHYYLPQNPSLSSLLNAVPNNPLDHGFDLGCEIGFLDNQGSGGGSSLMNRGGGVLTGFNDLSSNTHMQAQNLCSNLQFSTTRLPHLLENGNNFSAFRGVDDTSGNALFSNRSKMLRPLQPLSSVGAQPTLFQKRAALRKNLGGLGSEGGRFFGANVMVSVATQQASNPVHTVANSLSLPGLQMVTKKLELPVKIVFPRNLFGGVTPGGSTRDFMMLGLGDMAIPAMLLALVLCFDYRKSRDTVNLLDMHSSKGHKYIWYALPGYAFGLVTALAAGVLTQSPQPALLYLVPSTLGPIVVISWIRKELAELWDGPLPSFNDKVHQIEV